MKELPRRVVTYSIKPNDVGAQNDLSKIILARNKVQYMGYTVIVTSVKIEEPIDDIKQITVEFMFTNPNEWNNNEDEIHFTV